MASGKSTVGRKLAKKTGRFFVDTDRLIEDFEKKTINRIFSEEGEAYYRQIEKRCFEWLRNSLQNCVIATGGGVPMHIPDLQSFGRVVYLKIDFENVMQRLQENEASKRPLAKGSEELKNLYENRLDEYRRQADITVDASESAEVVVGKIIESLPNNTAS
jgi:shikimate kinase